jgi:3-keto-5-aminohexanoate cleavage enzyme
VTLSRAAPATSPTWVEVALNGPWSRARQPAMPLTVAELVTDGIACARAGAAIVHVHAYDPRTGLQDDDPETYAAVIEGIRGVEDVVVYPTLPFVQSADAFAPGAVAARYRAVEELGRRGLLEWGVVDPGSINLATAAEIAEGGAGSVYANPGEHVRHGLALAARFGAVPSYAIYEPGFLRLGAALARLQPGCPPPVYRFMFSDAFTFGFPPEPFALDAYLALLEREAPGQPWMVAGLGVEIGPLVPLAVARGGHVRVGLEDAPFGTTTGNLARVEAAIRAVGEAGGTVASATEVRARLAA